MSGSEHTSPERASSRHDVSGGFVRWLRDSLPTALGTPVRAGVTLLELLIVVAIVGILSGITAMGWSKVSNRLLGRGAAEEVRDAFTLARMDALTRKRHTGIQLDPTNLRYRLFLDGPSPRTPNGRFETGDSVVRDWTKLPAQPSFSTISSSISPDPVPRSCNQAAAATTVVSESGLYSVVFRPDGRSWSSFLAKMVPKDSRDTIQVMVLPSTGIITLERRP